MSSLFEHPLYRQAPPPELRYFKPLGEKAHNFAKRHPSLDRRITLLEGAVRSAKTWAMHPKVMQLSKTYEVKGLKVFGGVTKSTIKNNVLNDLFEIVGRDNCSYNGMTGEVELFGTKWLVVGARDEGSEKIIRGSTIGVYVGDELTLQAPSFVKMLLNRMSVEGARFYATSNPDTPFHYVYTDIMHNAALLRKGDVEVIHFDLDDNPNIPDWYVGWLNTIYPVGSLFHQRFVRGLWVTGEGAIYKDVFSEELLYDDQPWIMMDGRAGCVAPRGLRDPGNIAERTVAVDCGVDHVQCYGDCIDDGTTLWFDREYWWDSHVTMRQKTDKQYADDLEEFLKKAPNAKVIIPPECASFSAELVQRGIWHVDADNSVLDGIKTVSSMMGLRRIKFKRAPEGYEYDGAQPVHQHMGETVKQLQTYLWDKQAALRGEEQPLKQKDDGPDMVRYKVETDIPAWRLAS